MDTTCGSCLAFTTDGVDIFKPYRDKFDLPQIIMDYTGIKVSRKRRCNLLPLCINCANRLVDIEEFCTMYRRTQTKLRHNFLTHLKRIAIENIDTVRCDEPIRNDSDACDTANNPSGSEPSSATFEPVPLPHRHQGQQPSMRPRGLKRKQKPLSPIADIVRKTRVSANIERAMRRDRGRETVSDSGSAPMQQHDCDICLEPYMSAAHLRQHLIDQHAIVECTSDGSASLSPPSPPQPPLMLTKQGPHGSMATSKEHLCDICGYAGGSLATLRNHLRRHNNEKPYSCDRGCDIAFVCNSALQRHIRARHTTPDQRPYACDQCDRRFVTATHLAAHTFVHTKRKDFDCDICGLSFGFKHNLITHRRRHEHSQYPCGHCAKVFISKKNRTIHARREHPDANGPT